VTHTAKSPAQNAFTIEFFMLYDNTVAIFKAPNVEPDPF
jgi:hypothetical protein